MSRFETVDVDLPGDAGVRNLDPTGDHAPVVVDGEAPLQQQADDPLLARGVGELGHDLLEHNYHFHCFFGSFLGIADYRLGSTPQA